MKKLILAAFTLMLSTGLSQGVHASYWAKTYGTSGYDTPNTLQQAADGGFVVAGIIDWFGVNNGDIWVLKLDSNGNVGPSYPGTWQKSYGTSIEDMPDYIRQTADGGYIIAGRTGSYVPNKGNVYRFWILKLDSSGAIIWQKTYGGTNSDYPFCVQQTADGGYIVGGVTNSFGKGAGDIWLLKLDSNGNIIWEKAYGGTGDEKFYTVQQTSDNGYIVSGATTSSGQGSYDYLVLKLDSAGVITWQKTYGGSGEDIAYQIQQTSDGGYVVNGYTRSFNVGGGMDFWVLKLTSTGGITWQKTYGGNGFDLGYSVQQTTDGGYILAGLTTSYGTSGDYDFLVIKLDANGNNTWQKTYGSTGQEPARPIIQATDGGYVVAGYTTSFGTAGDFLVVKVDANGDIPQCNLIHSVSLTVSNTSVAAVTSSLLSTVSTATVANTTVTPIDTNATVLTQCEPPTLIELSGFEAVPASRKVTVQWTTASEIDNAGFNIYRSESENGVYVKINNALIPAEGSPSQGAAYEFTDTGVQNRNAYFYKLEDIDMNGVSVLHGPVSAKPRWILGLGK